MRIDSSREGRIGLFEPFCGSHFEAIQLVGCLISILSVKLVDQPTLHRRGALPLRAKNHCRTGVANRARVTRLIINVMGLCHKKTKEPS